MANGYPVGFPVFAEVVREEPVTRRGSFYNCQVAFLNLTLPDQRTHPCGCFRGLCKEHHTACRAIEPVQKPQKYMSACVVLAPQVLPPEGQHTGVSARVSLAEQARRLIAGRPAVVFI